VTVAYSDGVDSAFLLKAAKNAIGDMTEKSRNNFRSGNAPDSMI
jgi:hypothetical protein